MPETELTDPEPALKGTIRNMVATIFEPETRTPQWENIKAKIRYFAYSLEHTQEGRPHHQAFIQAWKPMRTAQWRELFPNIRLAKMLGSFRSNAAYCSKENSLTEFGEKPEINGQKTTLLAVKRKIDDGVPLERIADDDDSFKVMLQYRNGLAEYKKWKDQAKHEDVGWRKPDVYIRIGPPGSGKTRWVYDTYGARNVTVICGTMLTRGWFPRNLRDVVLFDDVEAGAVMPFASFKNLTDGYRRDVECKGGEVSWFPRVIVFTSNSHPFTWWKDLTDFDKAAIERRVTDIVVVD